jgi:membrane protease YdiL (CAAX protease family)
MIQTHVRGLCADLGFLQRTSFYRDAGFWLAILAGVVVVVGIRLLVPGVLMGNKSISLLLVFNSLVWYPLVEELLFRGVIQGQLYRIRRAENTLLGFSYANWVTSLLFVAVHFVHHSPLWAVSVIVPSLVFGYFRDRDSSILPAIALHSIYNAQYLLLLG